MINRAWTEGEFFIFLYKNSITALNY